MDFIPRAVDPQYRKCPADFSRTRKLPLHQIIAFILHLVAQGPGAGLDIEAGRFFTQAQAMGIWPEAQPAGRSAISQCRAKLPWEIFRDLLVKANALAEQFWAAAPDQLWHGLRVLAIDGSKFTLPASAELREEFDPQSGLEYPCKGHYPQALVNTLYDVMRRLPLARTVVSIHDSERAQVHNLLPFAPDSSIILFDRGYPAFDLLETLTDQFAGHFLMRGPASNTFREIEDFIRSGQTDAEILLRPSKRYLESLPSHLRRTKCDATIRLRAMRLESPDGKLSVLLTDLLDGAVYPPAELIELYMRRWCIEEYYRQEKIVMDVETFHGRTANAIRQELFAAAVMTVIARIMAAVTEENHALKPGQTQAKNALFATAQVACLLAAEAPAAALKIFERLLEQIARIKYYPPKTKRPPQPRITKRSPKKWNLGNRSIHAIP